MLEYFKEFEIHVYHSNLNKTWCSIVLSLVHLVEEPWLSCRNGMRDPIVVGLHVWRGEDGRGVETREL